MTEFRDVLHAWAARILDEHSGHAGPFTILNVWIDHWEPSSISSEQLTVSIEFDHPGPCPWSADYLAKYGYPPCAGHQAWYLPETTTTVKMLNELLDADARATGA